MLPLLIQGWTKFYEFSMSDLRAGFEIIDRLFEGRGAGNKHYNAAESCALLIRSAAYMLMRTGFCGFFDQLPL